MLDLSNSDVLLFGAGAVGTRKARNFNGVCRITAVSSEFSEEIKEFEDLTMIKADVGKLKADEIESLIEKHDIIITALPDFELNRKITEAAKSKGKLANSSDGGGNFLIPSVLKKGDCTITVSTNGKAPAVPPFICEFIDENIPFIEQMTEFESKLRRNLKEKNIPQKRRAEILRKSARDEKIQEALMDNNENRAMELALRYI